MNKKIKNLAKERPLQIMKVDELHLQDTVRGLKDAGLSYLNIANEINQKKLQGTGSSISPMSVMRWCHKNMPDDYSNQDENAVNIYRHAVNLMHAIDSQLDLLDTYIDSFATEAKSQTNVVAVTKQVTAFMSTYEKLSNRKIALLSTIAEIQSKVYSFQNASTIVNIVMDTVKEKDVTMYADIMQELKSEPLLAECYRQIKQ